MIRKIIQVGNSKGFTLPLSWEAMNGSVQKGDLVEIEIKRVVRNFNKTENIKKETPNPNDNAPMV
jgi:hypothetical protein